MRFRVNLFLIFIILLFKRSLSLRCYHKEPLKSEVMIDCSVLGGDHCLTCLCPGKNVKHKLFLIKECSTKDFTAERTRRCKKCETCKEDLCNGEPVPRAEQVDTLKSHKKPKVIYTRDLRTFGFQ